MDDDKKFDKDMDDDLSSILSDEEMAELLDGLGLSEGLEPEKSGVEEEEGYSKSNLDSGTEDALSEDTLSELLGGFDINEDIEPEETFEEGAMALEEFEDSPEELGSLLEEPGDLLEELEAPEEFENPIDELENLLEENFLAEEDLENTSASLSETLEDLGEDFVDNADSIDEFDTDNVKLEDLDFDFDDPEVSEGDFAEESPKISEMDFDFDEIGSVDSLEDLDFDDEDIEFIKDVAVYDTVERDDPLEQALPSEEESDGEIDEQQKSEYDAFINSANEKTAEDDKNEKKRRILKLPSFAHILACFLVLLILVVGGVGFFILSTIDAQAAGENELIVNVETITELARPVGNNSSSIFLTAQPMFFMLDIIEPLEVVANEAVTEFRFRYNVLWDRYNVTITDSRNREYGLLPESRRADNFGRQLRFEPLNSGINGIVLSIEEIASGLTHDFPFRFDELLGTLPVSHLSGRRTLIENSYFTVELQNAHFSNTVSDVTFSVVRSTEVDLRFDEVHLRMGGRRFPPQEFRYHQVDEITTIYNVKFAAAGRIDGNLELILSGPHFYFEVDIPVNTSALMRNTTQTQQRIMLEDHILTLERMGRMGPIYIMVGHIIDPEGERVHGDFDAVLTLRDTASGNFYQITGDVRSAAIGADILFDTRRLANFEELGNLVIHELRLNSVMIRHEDLVARTSMERSSFRRPVNDERFISAAQELLINDGAESLELILYYWLGDQFIAEFEVYESGEIRAYLLAGISDGREYVFERVLLQ